MSSVDILSEAIDRSDWNLAHVCLTCGPIPAERTIVRALEKVFR